MKKFASLIAVMALFAFAGAAFAANEGIAEVKPQDTAAGDVKVTADSSENTKSTGVFYYLYGQDLPNTIDLALKLKGTAGTFTGMKYGVKGLTGEYVIVDGVPTGDSGYDNKTFKIASADVSLTAKTDISVDVTENGSKVTGTGATGSVIVEGISVDVVLSADGEGVDEIETYANFVALDQALSIDVTDATIDLADVANLKLAVVSTDGSMISDDLVNTAHIDGLTFAITSKGSGDSTPNNVTIKGTPKAAGVYRIALYTTDEDEAKVGEYPVLGIVNLDSSGYKYCLTTLTLTVKENPMDALIDEVGKQLKGGVNFLTGVDSLTVVSGDSLGTVSMDKFITVTVVSADVDKDGNVTDLDVVDDGVNLAAKVIVSDTVSTDVQLSPDSEQLFGIYVYDLDQTVLNKLLPDTTTRGAVVTENKSQELTFRLPKELGGHSKQLTFVYTSSQTTGDKSSSGACSMGAGILALAGLALVLRKRG